MKHVPSTAVAELENWQHGGFALYVHWPFCQAKCPYCDFNSHVVSTFDAERWKCSLVTQVETWGRLTEGRSLTSIFFGGGTPSLMPPGIVEAVINAAQRYWRFNNAIEITLEANPTSADFQKFQDFLMAGVNRLSLGVQSFNDRALKELGRLHTASEALHALDLARAIFDTTSFDMIYARQHQSLADWRSELTYALGLQPEHLSLYQLTIEDGTVFAARQKLGRLAGLPDEDLSADMFALTQELCVSAGLLPYEISNHARGDAQGRHNLVYWRYGDYVGIGPGAHGRITLGGNRFATVQPKSPNAWLDWASRADAAAALSEPISAQDTAEEFLMMGLRLSEGVDLRRFQKLDESPLFPGRVDHLVSDGLLWRTGHRLGTTSSGRPLLNHVLRRLLGST